MIRYFLFIFFKMDFSFSLVKFNHTQKGFQHHPHAPSFQCNSGVKTLSMVAKIRFPSCQHAHPSIIVKRSPLRSLDKPSLPLNDSTWYKSQ